MTGPLRCATPPVRFRIGKERPRSEWQSLIRQLVGGGFLSLDVAGFGGLAIAPKGRALIAAMATSATAAT